MMGAARLVIVPGTGGPEATAWAGMVRDMYIGWAGKRGYSAQVQGWHLLIEGAEAALLRSEHGVHRLARLSPFDAGRRRHTSFTNVVVRGVEDDGEPHQVRSYVENPYRRVKDLRTNVETADVAGVLSGDLDAFLEEARKAGWPRPPRGPNDPKPEAA